MKLVISSSSIGSHKHLQFDGEMWEWVSEPDGESLLFGFDSPRDIGGVFKALNISLPTIETTPWWSAQSVVQSNLSCVPWMRCMPHSAWKTFVLNLVDRIWLSLTSESNSYYCETFIRNREVIWSLQRPRIDTAMVKNIISVSDNGVAQNLMRFLPKSGDVAPHSQYSLVSSVTGRMTVSSGPNILTLKRDHRKILRSRYKGGKIIEIDIQSAEPRLALALFGRSIEGDVYKDVMRCIDLDITRDVAKVATLSAIYGASHHSIQAMLPENVGASRVLDLVKDYFSVDIIEKMLKEQHDELGYIVNTHGRKILSQEASVNHLIQSSSVDVAFDIFESILAKLRESDIVFSPIYLIHDAIILDICGEHVDKLKEACKGGFVPGKIKIRFPVRIKEIN